MAELATWLSGKGSILFATEPADSAVHRLPTLPADQAESDALCLIQRLYTMIVRLAGELGTDIDRPRNLNKVTRTV